MVLVAVACGTAGAFAAVVFRTLIRIFTGLFFEGAEGVGAVIEEGWLAEAHDPLEVARALPWYWKVAIPAMGAGYYGIAPDLCARVVVGVISDRLESATCIEELIICVLDTPQFEAFQAALPAQG